MATGNFKSMCDFPLIVAGEEYMKICPECGCGQGGTPDKCEICGADLTGVDAEVDEFYAEDMVREMEAVAERLNNAQPFYKVTVESGYYSGVQFYVDENYYKLEECDNEYSQSEFGMCRSAMLRKYKSAGNMIRRELRKAKADLGLMELGVSAVFGNGEVWYSKVA